jgi:hypothetical protein
VNNTINSLVESEAAIYAESTLRYSKADILREYGQHPEKIDIHRFCQHVLGISLDIQRFCKQSKTYQIAFVKEDGSWDIVEQFLADDDEDANDYADEAYAGREWFVLDENGNNINGGDQ